MRKGKIRGGQETCSWILFAAKFPHNKGSSDIELEETGLNELSKAFLTLDIKTSIQQGIQMQAEEHNI